MTREGEQAFEAEPILPEEVVYIPPECRIALSGLIKTLSMELDAEVVAEADHAPTIVDDQPTMDAAINRAALLAGKRQMLDRINEAITD